MVAQTSENSQIETASWNLYTATRGRVVHVPSNCSSSRRPLPTGTDFLCRRVAQSRGKASPEWYVQCYDKDASNANRRMASTIAFGGVLSRLSRTTNGSRFHLLTLFWAYTAWPVCFLFFCMSIRYLNTQATVLLFYLFFFRTIFQRMYFSSPERRPRAQAGDGH